MANSPAYGLSNYALTVQNSTANSTVFSNSITGGTEFTIDGQGNITSTGNTIVGRSLVFSDGSVLSTASGASAVFDYTGDGVTTAFSTGNYSATSTLNTNVFISGVYQRKNQYTWSGTTITFTQPPPAGLSIEINIQTINTVITVPSAGTVTPSTLSTGGPSWDTFGNVTVSSNLSVLGTGNSYFAGNVGIGSSSPTVKLDISATGGGSSIARFFNSNATAALSWRTDNGTYTTDIGIANPSYIGFQGIAANTAFLASSAPNGIVLTAYAAAPIIMYTNAGTERMRIASSGDVQIGTSADAGNTLRYLDVQNTNVGTSAGAIIRLITNNAAGSATTTVDIVKYKNGQFVLNNNDSAGYTTFGTAGTERMRIASNGSVGIGDSNPSIVLSVLGASGVNADARSLIWATDTTAFAAGVGGGISFRAKYNTAGSYFEAANIKGIKENGTDGNFAGAMVFTTGPAGGSPTERMRIDSSGNVGIGTTSPSKKLEVYAASNSLQILSVVRNDNTNTGVAAIGFNTSGSAASEATSTKAGIGLVRGFAFGGGALAFYNNNSGVAGDFTTADEKMRIDSSGNFLVGTTTTNPGNASNVKGFGVENSTGSTFCSRSGDAALFVNRVDTTGAVINMKSATVTVGSIAVTSSATAYNTSSDYRLKNSVVPMTIGLATVNALKPVTYKWNADNSDGEGFIAHELQSVIPHAVTGEKDAVNEDGTIKSQGVDYSKIVVHLVAAIQELKAEFDAYKESHP